MVVAASPRQLESIPIHGLYVHHVDMAQTLETIDSFIRDGSPHHVITLDASMCVTARDDAQLRGIARSAELVTPDGAGILWACSRLGTPLPERVSGVEIVDKICALSSTRGYRIFFFGAGPEVAGRAADQMRDRYPGCQIVGTRDGYFTPGEELEIVEQIRAARPDVLFVALGIPKQEKWIAKFRDALGVPVMVGVGGSFDVHSGRVKRAPRWVQRLNLEWLYRTLANPKKIAKAMTLPKFAVMTLRAGKRS